MRKFQGLGSNMEFVEYGMKKQMIAFFNPGNC